MKHLSPTLLIACAVIGASLILTYGIRSRNDFQNVVSVTGLGSKNFVSDLIVWKGTFSRKNMDLKDAYAALDRDREIIRNFMNKNGLRPNEIVFSSVQISRDYTETFDAQGNRTSSIFNGFNLTQNIEIESKSVNQVETISRIAVSELISNNIEFSSQEPDYFYTKLSDLKLEMIALATNDARLRAQNIVEHSGSKLGKLKSADMGVIQIVGENSTEDYSWGGSFNTKSKRKTASITVSLEFKID
ncbi:MAG: SIMPL domain-containing protein [Bacteroidota bacterium]|jgi:hypothetical protein